MASIGAFHVLYYFRNFYMNGDVSMLKNKIILVTGGANGIGKAIADKFSKENRVIVIDIDKKACELLKKQNNNIDVYNEDLTNYELIEKLISNIYLRYHNIDILINNAAVQTANDIMDLSLKDFERVIDVNLTSNFYITQLIGNQMKNDGTILNIISTHYNKPRQDKIHYDISKAAVAILTKGFARALSKKKITVNALAIGATFTNMNIDFENNEEIVNIALEKIPLNYICTPEDIANYTHKLIENFSKHTTGSIFVIDGGRNLI